MDDGPMHFQVAIEEVDHAFHLRCASLGDHTWAGRTPQAALEAFSADILDLMDRFVAARP